MLQKLSKRVVFIALSAMLLSSCARVQITGRRTEGSTAVHVTKLYQYSFLTMNPLGMKKLDRDLSAFSEQLAIALRAHQFDVVAEEAQVSALRNNLPINMTRNGHYLGTLSAPFVVASNTVPVNLIIAANKATEDQLMISHRLILFPAMTTYDGGTANVSSDVNWRFQDVKDGKVVAEGSIHYIADIRGFPGQEIADRLASELEALNIQ
jgi:hypothetical protein